MKLVWFLDIGYTPPPSRGRRVPECSAAPFAAQPDLAENECVV